MTVRRRWLALALLGLVIAVAPASVAEAHAQVARSEPPAGSKGAAPAVVKVWFTEPVDRAGSSLAVMDAKGATVDLGDKAQPAGEAMLLTVSLKPNLPDGVYTVKWSALTEDGGKTAGEFQFGVGASSNPATPAPTAVSTGGIAATVAITSPAEGAVITGPDVPLEVSLRQVALVESERDQIPAGVLGGHLHVWVDGTVIAMPATAEALVIRGLASGTHTIRVEVAAPNHLSYSPTIDATRRVEVKDGAKGGSVTLTAGGRTVSASLPHDHDGHSHTDRQASGGRTTWIAVAVAIGVLATVAIAVGVRAVTRR